MVEDLLKAGLSVRTIANVTDIPRSSVHRAMRAIIRAEAKKEVAIAKIACELLGARLPHMPGGDGDQEAQAQEGEGRGCVATARTTCC